MFSLLALQGCLSSNYYILSTASQPRDIYPSSKLSVGVEKVTVPEYLFKREIAVAKSASEVHFVNDGTWAEDMDAGLTTRLISFLQKKFNTPNVHLYPWNVDTQPSKKVQVHISRFIAQGDTVYLDATWDVEDIHTHHKNASLFQKRMMIKQSGTSGIVKTMNNAFGLLENTIATGLKTQEKR